MDDEAPLKGVREGECSIRHAYPRASKQVWLILVLVAVLMAAGLTASMLRPAAEPASALLPYSDSEGDSRADADSFTVVGSLRTTENSSVTSVCSLRLKPRDRTFRARAAADHFRRSAPLKQETPGQEG